MRQIAFVFAILLLPLFNSAMAQDKKQNLAITAQDDTTEYELIIIEPGFDSWFELQKPASFYTNEYYRQWNLRYVTEWNILYTSNPGKYPQIESYIDYRPETDYGIELNHKLYWYFIYFEKKHDITLVYRGNK